MTNTTKWVIGIVVVLVVIIGLVQANKKDSSQTTGSGGTTTKVESSGPIKVGVILPLTGDAAAYGEPMRNALTLAADDVNKNGGVGGKDIVLIYEDGKCSGKDAASAASKLVSIDKVQVIIGGFCSSESLAALPVVETAKVALFSGGSSSPDLTGKSRFFFRDYPSDASQGKVLAELAWKRGLKKVAFIQEQLDYPWGLYKA
ncbi:MAG: ABC transporter substrate-binding protein, partial [Candidatus Doudnabacteria bacterium]|nr:ABC transporter substrate-binding protein [Candidatus Doudnabacteria bacterium]